jgi:hypothetical protein
MSVSVRIPTILRTYTNGESEVSADGGTLAEVLESLETDTPEGAQVSVIPAVAGGC